MLPAPLSRRPRLFAATAAISLAAMTAASAGSAPPFVAAWLAGDPPAAAAPSWREQAGAPVVHAARRGAPWLGLEDGQAVPVAPAKALATEAAFAAATADFDADGTRDLVTGYAGPEGGVVTIARGNVDAIYPNAPAAQARRAAGTFTDAPFLPDTRSFALPVAAEMVGAGDFDADGRMDVVAAKAGDAALYWLKGDGAGNLSEAQRIELDGKVTALVAGEIDAADGLDDVAVGVARKGTARVLLFAARNGAFNTAPEEIAVPGPVTSLVTGQLDDHYEMDLAVAAGGRLVVVHGQRTSARPAKSGDPAETRPRAETVEVGFRVAALASGDFTGDARQELALAGEDGAIRLWQRGVEGVRPWGAAAAKRRGAPLALVRTHSSTAPHDDLVVVDAENRRLRVFMGDAGENAAADAPRVDSASEPVDLEVVGEPMAVVGMRLNPDARTDLVVVTRWGLAPIVAPTGPGFTHTVDSTLDTGDTNQGDGICDDGLGNCTLRAAIDESNASSGADTINFSIGTGAVTLTPSANFFVGSDVTIDATTQPGFAGAPLITVDGSAASGAGPTRGFVGGFLVGGSSSVMRGLVINNWDGQGIAVGFGAQFNMIEGNYIGTNPAGTAAAPNGFEGIEIFSASNNTIGGSTEAARNVISGNADQGVDIEGQDGAFADNNVVQGNYIGTNAAGTEAISNGLNGVHILYTNGTNIGGPMPGQGNVISGNQDLLLSNGIFNNFPSFGTIIQGNVIGLSADGSTTVANGVHGIIDPSGQTTIGGSQPGAGNVISGNFGVGIQISSTSIITIDGNFIGTDGTGMSARPNAVSGIVMFDAGGYDIGSVFGGNVISGNGVHGIEIIVGKSVGTGTIIGNKIGVGADGSTPIGNSVGSGIRATNQLLFVEENIIANNGADGIALFGDQSEVSIETSTIYDNGGLGIDLVDDGPTVNDADDLDNGPNSQLNYPVVTTASFDGSSLAVTGSIDSAEPLTLHTVELFVNSGCDPSGFGEGERFAGSFDVTTDINGDATFMQSVVPDVPVNPGDVLTTTATWKSGGARGGGPISIETSEFSPCVAINTPSADLAVTIDNSPNISVDRGENLTYTITVTNNGPADATTALLSTATPANTTFVSFSAPPGWTVMAPTPGGTGAVTATNESLTQAAGVQNFTFVVNVNPDTPGSTIITGAATVSSDTPDPNPGDNMASVQISVTVEANVSATISDSPDPVARGANITYDISFFNDGPDSAGGAFLSIDTPPNTTFVSFAAPPGWDVSAPMPGATGNVQAFNASAPAVTAYAFTLVVQVDPGTAGGTDITATVNSTSSTPDPNPDNNMASTTTTVEESADLAVTIGDSPDPVNPGQNITYSITLQNNGPDDTSGPTLNISTPPNTTFVSFTAPEGWFVQQPMPGETGAVMASNEVLTPGAGVQNFTLVVQVDFGTASGTVINATANAGGNAPDPNTANNMASTTTTVGSQANLGLTLVSMPNDEVLAGQNITYTITVTNGGPDDAINTVMTTSVPDNTTFVSFAAPPGWTPSTPAPGGTGPVSASRPTLTQAAGVQTFTLVVNVPPSTPGGTIIGNAASVFSDTFDPNTVNNASGGQAILVANTADLAVTIADAPDPVDPGANITYSIGLTNNGPDTASGGSLTIATPANTTFVSFSAPIGWDVTAPAPGGTGTVTATNKGVNLGTQNFTLVVQVNPGTPGGTVIGATVSASSATADPNSGNNMASTTTTVTSAADLSVTIGDAPDPVSPGANVTYSITLNNAGPDPAASASLSIATPAGTTFVSFSAPAGWNVTAPAPGATGTVTATNPSAAAGTANFSLVVQVDPNAVDATVVSATVSATSATPDPTSGNNMASTTTTVQAVADLAVTISDAPDPVSPGANITYSIVLTNNGPHTSTFPEVGLSTPAGTTFVSFSAPAGWNVTQQPPAGGTGLITASRTSLLPGAGPQSFTLVVQVVPGTPGGTTINASVNASSDNGDPVEGNNSASTTTTVASAADLSVTISDAPDPVLPGGNITYTVTVANAGPDPSSGPVLSLPVPANTTFVSTTEPAGWDCTTPAPGGTGTITCNSEVFPVGNAVFTVVVQTNGGAADGTVITASPSVSSAFTPDPTPGNNSASTTTTVIIPAPTEADLSVSKSAAPAAPLPGDDVTFSLTVTNAGPATATNVTLADAVPANTTFRSLAAPGGWTCESPGLGGTGQITCTAPSLGAGASAVFTVVVRVDQTAENGAVITNTATVSATGTVDPVPANNTASASVTVGSPSTANLSILKTVNPGEVVPGSTVTFTITATNIGPSPAPNLTITDVLPEEVTFASATPSAGGSVTAPAAGTNGTVVASWTGPTEVGESRTLTIVVGVSDLTPDQTTVTNTASVSSGLPDLDTTNNEASASFLVALDENAPRADISIVTTTVPNTVDTGTFLDYVFVVTNNGPDTATNVTLSGSTPDGTRFVSIESSPSRGPGGACTTPPVGGTGSFSCNLGDIPAGSSVTVTLTVNVVAPGGTIISISVVTSSDVNDPNPNNNASSSGSSSVVAGLDTQITWDPPLPCPDDCLNPPLHLQSFTAPPPSDRFTGHLPSIVRDPRNTVIGYNVYRSNNPNVTTNPANFFTSVPPNVTSLVVPTAPGGSFFTVTAQYPNGESGGTNAASGGIPEPQITGFEIRGKQVIIFGTGFTDTVTVFIDGIPFKKAAKVKDGADGRRIVQKGKLLTGQKVSSYFASQGNVILVSVLNTDTGIGTFLFRGQ